MGLQESMKALGDPTRRDILVFLREGPLKAGEIAARFDMTQATVSHHLSVLREAGLIQMTRNGKYLVYELNATVFQEIMAWFMSMGAGAPGGKE